MKRLFFIGALFYAGSIKASFDTDPIYEKASATNGVKFLAVRPFYSSVEDLENERWRKDYLWPLYTQKGFKDEQYGRFLFFGFSTDFSTDTDRHRTWVIPFYFKGTSAEDENYFALFPLGGSICEILGRDKMTFVLFPLYGKSHVNEVYTTSILWPIYSKSKGEKVDRFRIWPLYGRTDLLDEYQKKFIFWPLYTSVEYTNERNPGGGFILIPIYGQVKTEKAHNYWLIPPFFRYMTSEEQWIVHAPWPFIQMADGEMYKRIIWPLYGKKHLGTLTKQYFLWPILWNNTTEYATHDQHRRRGVPFFVYQSNVITKKTEKYEVGDVSSRYWKIWPLMSWERKHQNSRFRTLELWPLRNTLGIEYNWAPYWSLYKRINTDGEVSHHILWGLYRQEKSSEQFEWSLLKGFVGYKKTDTHRSYRILFMEFGAEKEQL